MRPANRPSVHKMSATLNVAKGVASNPFNMSMTGK